MESSRPTGVTVTGYGEATATPDVLRAFLQVRGDGPDVSSAMTAVGERSAAVTAALREVGLADRDLRTATMAVQERRNRDGSRVGYRAVHALTVTCRDPGRASRVLGAAAAAAGNDIRIDHVGLDLDDRTAVLEQARAAAFVDARRRAEHYAVLAGRELGLVQEVVEGGDDTRPVARGMATMAAVAGPELDVEAGENTVQATVTVRWSWA